MEILNKFGFQPQLFVAQIINFLILAFVFKKFLYKPILKMLKKREDKIKQGLQDAEQSKLELEKAETEKNLILKNASKEAEDILENTKKMADEIREKILNDTKSQSNKIIQEAKAQAKLEMEEVEKAAKKLSLDLSQKILENVISQVLTGEDKDKIMKKSLEIMPKYE